MRILCWLLLHHNWKPAQDIAPYWPRDIRKCQRCGQVQWLLKGTWRIWRGG